MAKKKTEIKRKTDESAAPAEPMLQPLTDTIEKNYMPYVMSVIISRAIPDIDGFKPAHRKLLYTMYKMGLMTGPRTKSANVVGQTMRLNPHGDASIYETMVRLTRGNEALLHPFVDSKGSFGKQYSSDMAYAASRYTEVKLDPFCAELFGGIDKNAVDMIDNYDATMKEPTLLPTSFPNILVSPNMGIAVGMASKICSFNLAEICDGTIQLLRYPETTVDQMLDIVKAPDFTGGGYLLYDRNKLREIYSTGRGSFTLRSRYEYDRSQNCIDILQIPYSTSIELIQKRLTDLMKEGKLKEVSDFRDEIDLNGFKLTIDLRRGADPDKLMAKLFKLTPLQDDFSCNFNVLVNNAPRTMGIIELLNEWIRFRISCVKRELTYELGLKEDKLHLLLGLGKILLDIDKAIAIVRGTENDKDVVPNLMAGFGIDKIQAEYVADIKLRYLNREYILNRIAEIEQLQKDIAELKETIGEERKLKNYIIKQLKAIKEKYGKPRNTQIMYDEDIPEYDETSMVEDYNCRFILTNDGYFKKIQLVSLRGSDEQKYKEGDSLRCEEDGTNRDELMFFSDRCQVYKVKVADFDAVKASALGDYIPAKLGFDEGERVIFMKKMTEYPEKDNFIFLFQNGKGVRVPVSAYQTKTNRKKLVGAYSDAAPIAGVAYEDNTTEGAAPTFVLLEGSHGKGVMVAADLIVQKVSRSSSGSTLFSLKKGQMVVSARGLEADEVKTYQKLKKTKVPATGSAMPEGTNKETV